VQYKNAREKGTAGLPMLRCLDDAYQLTGRVRSTLDSLPAGVAIAARSLISLYRDVDPTMLHKKDRGRVAQENLGSFEAPRYGDFKPTDHVPGAELLQAMLSKDTPSKKSEVGSDADSDDAGGADAGDEENEWDGWEVASDESIESDDNDGEWIDVHHSSDDEAGPSGTSADTAAGAALLATASAKRDNLIEAERVRVE